VQVRCQVEYIQDSSKRQWAGTVPTTHRFKYSPSCITNGCLIITLNNVFQRK